MARPPAKVDVALEEVATKREASTKPVARMSPETSSLYEGVATPMPTSTPEV